MAKAQKYPKKFRVTLEKVAAKKAGRELLDRPLDPDFFSSMDMVFVKAYARNVDGLAGVYAKFSDDAMRLRVNYQLSELERPEEAVISAPWDPHDKPAPP